VTDHELLLVTIKALDSGAATRKQRHQYQSIPGVPASAIAASGQDALKAGEQYE
jgi:hypothetical protein